MGTSQSVTGSPQVAIISQVVEESQDLDEFECEVCETDRPIKWKCLDCGSLLCDHCKEKVHPKFQNAKDHHVVNIEDLVVELNINKEYQTELSAVCYISYCHDDSLWIYSHPDEILQRVKFEGTKMNVISSFNIKVDSMAVTRSNNLLISIGEAKFKQINSKTGKITDNRNSSLSIPRAVFITTDNKVLVGGYNQKGKLVVKRINQNGDTERVYELDQNKQPIFIHLWRITSTSNGNIHVVSGSVSNDRDRVIVLGQEGKVINIYTGNTEINKDEIFQPMEMVTTPKDNVIVADLYTHTLHILNNAGLLLTYFETSEEEIFYPVSLALSKTGQLYIGCPMQEESTTKEAMLYEVTISGF